MIFAALYWGMMFCASGVAWIISLFFVLSHKDLNTGKTTAQELTEDIRCFYPIEMVMHFAEGVSFLLYGETLSFLGCVPMCLYNLKVIFKKEIRCYAMFKEDFKEKRYMERMANVKLIFNTLIGVYILVNLVSSLSSGVDGLYQYYENLVNAL
jgi:hypothetical protein